MRAPLETVLSIVVVVSVSSLTSLAAATATKKMAMYIRTPMLPFNISQLKQNLVYL
jgi:hypothetical protein